MTLQLARQLNAVEILQVNAVLQDRHHSQPFKYLLVIDFEATCWDKNDNKGVNEIIEFPCILYDVNENKVLSEFQQYVMPVENPKLSSFCISLTGIKQNEVDRGVPLGTCLSLFNAWIRRQELAYKFSYELNSKNRCIAATWSDWDLGTCLVNECRRKSLKFPSIFNNWIDVRALYREHYFRRPKGLYGALLEVGLQFEGQQHCGLHDARNTAKLVGRMISDGVLLRMTKSLVN